jgi:hypothetical protein
MQPQIKQSKMAEEKPRNANLHDAKTSEGEPRNAKPRDALTTAISFDWRTLEQRRRIRKEQFSNTNQFCYIFWIWSNSRDDMYVTCLAAE